MSKQLSLEKKNMVISHFKEGKTIRKISEIMSIPRSTVHLILKNYKERGTTKRPLSSGRQKVLSDQEVAIIKKKINLEPKLSSSDLAIFLKGKSGKDISARTVRNYIKELGFRSHLTCKKPLISKKNKSKRIALAKNWIFWNDNDWKQVIFSDECQFNIFGTDNNHRVWRKPGERYLEKNLQKTVKYGYGSLMVWGCMSSSGVGKLVFVEGIMDSLQYINILSNNLYESARILNLENFIFQQDNDPKHTARITKRFFEEKQIKVLDWPSQSPDLNPIEHLWAHIKKLLSKKKLKNKTELKEELTNIWKSISQETCENVVNSMNRRVREVLKAKGAPTKY